MLRRRCLALLLTFDSRPSICSERGKQEMIDKLLDPAKAGNGIAAGGARWMSAQSDASRP
jgi:hypothetical protein